MVQEKKVSRGHPSESEPRGYENGNSYKHERPLENGSVKYPKNEEEKQTPWWKGQEDIVISGVSVRMPQSDNMQEFTDNLMNGIDMVTEDSSRWPPGIYGVPRRHGKLKNYEKMDAAFFSITPKQANVMDPQQRMLLEVAYEAILDSGYNPQTLRSFKVGVFVGCTGSEMAEVNAKDPETMVGHSILGTHRAMFANRLSFTFNFNGPSFVVDTGCSSSLIALKLAVESMRQGECDVALVAGTHMTLAPMATLQFKLLSLLSPEGKCQSFDAGANGFVRSEGIGAMLLQRPSVARRRYCTIIHVKTSTDGYKSEGINYPSRQQQKQLFVEFYREIGVHPHSVNYFECHGTGTKAGDPQEANAICDFFCNGREDALLIGSVKSNMGHSEQASGIAGLAKVLIAMETGIIPGNLHYKQPNPDIPGLFDGRIKVVDKNTPLPPGYIGINSMGFGGTNCHALLKPYNDENKPRRIIPSSVYPRIVCFSGRTQDSVESIMNAVVSRPNDYYLQALLAENANLPVNQCPYRGYMLMNQKDGRVLQREVSKVLTTEKKQVWFVFSGLGGHWAGMGRELMCIDIFRQTIERCSAVLLPPGLNVMNMIMAGTEDVFKDIQNSFACVCAIQIAFIETLKLIGITPDGIIGHSTGEMAAGYADGCTTLEETMLIAYNRGIAITHTEFPAGAMAAVGLSKEEVLKRAPKGVWPACYNTQDSVTVSGDRDAINEFVETLKDEDIFVKPLKFARAAFHSPHMRAATAMMLACLKQAIKQPKLRSKRWITTGFPEDKWDTECAKYCSAEYIVNNLVSPVYFHQALQKVPPNSVTIEIGPHTVLTPLLHRSLQESCSSVSLMKNGENNLEFFFRSLGKIHGAGVPIWVERLYPRMPFPVPRGTPMISPLIRWDHSQTWATTDPNAIISYGSPGKPVSIGFHVDPYAPESKDVFLLDHMVDGRVFFPFTGYLVLAWRAISKLRGLDYTKIPVIMEDVKAQRATLLTKPTKFNVSVSFVNGDFEIVEGDSVCATGRVVILDSNSNQPFYYANLSEKQLARSGQDEESETIELLTQDVYKELKLRGYEYAPHFRSIKRISHSGKRATIAWTNNWITFLDAMLQSVVIADHANTLRLPVRLRYLRIDPTKHLSMVKEEDGQEVIRALFDHKTNGGLAGGVEMRELVMQSIQRRLAATRKPTLERIYFCPLTNVKCFSEVPKMRNDLHAYNDACRNYAIHVLKCLESNSDSPNHAIIKKAACAQSASIDETALEKYFNDPACTFIQLLNKIYHETRNSRTGQPQNSLRAQLRRVIRENLGNLEKDKLWSATWTDFPLKPFLDVVVEARQDNHVRAAAIEPRSIVVPKLIRDTLCTNPLQELSWTIVDANADNLVSQEICEQNSMVAFKYDMNAGHAKIDIPDEYKNHDVVVLDRVLHRKVDTEQYLERIKSFLKDDGFVIVNEVTGNFEAALAILALQGDIPTAHLNGTRKYSIFYNHNDWVQMFNKAGFRLVGYQSDDLMTTLYLLRKVPPKPRRPTFFDIEDVTEFSWLKPVQAAVEELSDTQLDKSIWLKSTKAQDSGLIGLGLCLRDELKTTRLHTLMDSSLKNTGEQLRPTPSELKHIVDCGLHSNVYRDGKWGTFQHIVEKEDETFVYKETEHAFVGTLVRGDFSTLQWIESSNVYWKYLPTTKADSSLCQVYFAALNFKDIMLATGRVPPESVPGNFIDREHLLGMEFSGRLSSDGRRVMGLVPALGLSTTTVADTDKVWDVPDGWTLQEAATVPVVYLTCYYALIFRGRLQKGEKVLIHSGSGGVGLAAISVALAAGAEVYATVSSDEKKKFVQARFPQLKDDHFSNSRTTEFEFHILQMTDGKGVDVVLNSLSDDKLQASVRCLAEYGRFLEIGKADLLNNTPLGTSILLKNASVHGIFLDKLAFEEENKKDWDVVRHLFEEGVANGVVKPLPACVFPGEKPEEAFRYLAQGKHVGKVLLKLREEEQDKCALPKPFKIRALCRTLCHPQHCYLITGGLGGFGLELTQFLITRGARNIVLTGRRGVRTGYQASRLLYWRGLGIKVVVSNLNIADAEQAIQLIQLCQQLGPLGGVFHLAMVLRDALFEHQTITSFKEVAEPKHWGLRNLDEATRKLCGEELRWFAVWSSIVSGRGNYGQTNYGWANSCMERMIEKRRADGLSGMAISWGAVGDVGAVAENMDEATAVVHGTLPQPIHSCLQAFDLFLSWNHPIVCSIVRADTDALKNKSKSKDPVAAVAHLLGASDIDQLDANSTFSELGLDSLMSIEIKQVLERDFDVVLALKEIRVMTLNKLREVVKNSAGAAT